MEKLSSTLKQLLTEANISEAELARRTGIAQPMVNRLATGKNKNPKLETLKPIAKYFSVTFSQLLGEEDLPNTDKRADRFDNQTYQLPVINWDLIDQLNNPGFNQANNTQMIPTTAKASSKAFAVLINNNKFEPRFPNNTILIIEPEATAINNDFVIARSSESKMVLGQLKINNGNSTVLNLSSEAGSLGFAINSDAIVGVLIHTSYDFK